MFRRYYIRLGATTTAGGVVRTATTQLKVNGVALAVAGDLVDCPACASEGVIECVGPRMPDRYDGKALALSDDLCICRCSPPPRLVADQDFKFQTLAQAGDASAGEAAARAVSARTEELTPVRLRDDVTGKPHVNQPYRLELTDKVIEGVTDADGLTRPLTRAERDALLAWHVTPPPAAS